MTRIFGDALVKPPNDRVVRDEQSRALLLVCEDVFHGCVDSRLTGVGPCRSAGDIAAPPPPRQSMAFGLAERDPGL